jgi:hypothetical protein
VNSGISFFARQSYKIYVYGFCGGADFWHQDFQTFTVKDCIAELG